VISAHFRSIRNSASQLREMFAEKVDTPQVGNAAIFLFEGCVEISATTLGDLDDRPVTTKSALVALVTPVGLAEEQKNLPVREARDQVTDVKGVQTPRSYCAFHGYDISFHLVSVLDESSLSRCTKKFEGSTYDTLRAGGSSHDTV
jgi:hypothetical protein